MKAYQEVGLTLLENDVTFKNGQLLDEESLLEEDLIGNRSYRSAEDVKEGRPRNLMYLGEGVVTFNDTGFPFPYRPEFFRDDGELMSPAEILRTVYETVEEISDARDDRDERLEEIEEEVSTIAEEALMKEEVEEEFRDRFDHFFVEGYEPEDVMYDSVPHPDHLEDIYNISWTEGSLNSTPDLSRSEELESFFDDDGEFEGFGLRDMWIKTEGGRLFPLYSGMSLDDFGRNNLDSYSKDEAFFKVPKVYHAVGFALAENNITFKDGVYVTNDDLKEAGVIDSTNYKSAWDVVMGRPDTVLTLGNGKVTFNNTDFSLPWSTTVFHEPVEYGDITSYDGEPDIVEMDIGNDISESSADLRGPADILQASHKAWQEAREISEKEALEALTATGVEVKTLDEEDHVDPEKVTHSYPLEWRKGSIEGLPEFSDPEEVLRALDNVAEIEDVVRNYGRFGESYQRFRVSEAEDPVRQRETEKVEGRNQLRE